MHELNGQILFLNNWKEDVFNQLYSSLTHTFIPPATVSIHLSHGLQLQRIIATALPKSPPSPSSNSSCSLIYNRHFHDTMLVLLYSIQPQYLQQSALVCSLHRSDFVGPNGNYLLRSLLPELRPPCLDIHTSCSLLYGLLHILLHNFYSDVDPFYLFAVLSSLLGLPLFRLTGCLLTRILH